MKRCLTSFVFREIKIKTTTGKRINKLAYIFNEILSTKWNHPLIHATAISKKPC